jgi:hypothetical protein
MALNAMRIIPIIQASTCGRPSGYILFATSLPKSFLQITG